MIKSNFLRDGLIFPTSSLSFVKFRALISAISVKLKLLNSKLTIVKILTNSDRRLVEPDPELCILCHCSGYFAISWHELILISPI